MHTIRCCRHFHLASTQSPCYELLSYIVLTVHFAPLFGRNWGQPVIRQRSVNWSETSARRSATLLPACFFTAALTTVNCPTVATRIFSLGAKGGGGAFLTLGLYNLCLILKTMACKSCQNLRATSSLVTGRTGINGKRKNLQIRNFLLYFNISMYWSPNIWDFQRPHPENQ
jgi:hypothetical protein